MNNIQDNALSKIKVWFDKADNWQKDLFIQLWQGNENIDKLSDRAFNLAKKEYLEIPCKYTATTTFPSDVQMSSSSNCPILLKNISDVQGVGALAPTKPLEFGDNLTIVYGENGCGKSSYVRILKSAASPKNSDTILPNVFSKNNTPPKAVLTYNDDGNEISINWSPNLKSSCPLNIYDSSIAKRFAEDKNEVIYEPRILSLLSIMVKVYQSVNAKFDELISENNGKKSPIDISANNTIIDSFLRIKTSNAHKKFIQNINWSEKEKNELFALQEGLRSQNAPQALTALKAQLSLIENNFKKLFDLSSSIGDSIWNVYLQKRENQIKTKKEADDLILGLRNNSAFIKVGSTSWKNMWLTAIKFAQEETNTDTSFVDISGKCALCQQDLSEISIKRLQYFSEYMTSTAIKKSEDAYNIFKAAVDELQKIYSSFNIENIEATLSASSIPDEIIELIISNYKIIRDRCKWMLDYDSETTSSIPDLPNLKELQKEKEKISSAYSTKITTLQEIVNNRTKTLEKVAYLLAIKWINENKIIHQKDILLKSCISKCKTNSLTTLKKDLTELLITSTYISRFQNEMQIMDTNNKIHVELVSKGAEKGRAYHQVALKGAVQQKKTGEVLSEGEFRVVSLAAFLADLSSWNKILPFIFDDPITSLDHKYEKKVAERLVELSSERQVIVFTHRLNFVQMLDASAKEYNNNQKRNGKTNFIITNMVQLRNNPLGEPIPPTFDGSIRMDKALKKLRDEDVARTKKLYKSNEYTIADNYLQSICSKFRNIVEQGIEMELLSKIVTRFDFSVKSMSLRYLHIITDNDIDLFENLMTKYSFFDHSHSIERPIALPSLDDVEKDIEELLNWYSDFKKRCEKA